MFENKLINKLEISYHWQGTFAFSLIKYSPLKYNNEYVYPWWGNGIGWILALSSMLCIPVWVAVKLYYTPGTMREVCFICFDALARFLTQHKKVERNELLPAAAQHSVVKL